MNSIRLFALTTVTALALAGCGSSYDENDGGNGNAGRSESGSGELTVMIGSSGEAETRAVQDATKRFTDTTGTKVRVIPAQDLTQQLQQGFAGGSPPDVFYVSPDRFRMYVDGGSLYPYGDQLDDAEDFYPSLRKAFTYEDELYCAPKDGGNHALVIDTEAWKRAGLTDADIPQDWDQLAEVAERLTTEGRVGLAFGRDYNVIGTFLLAGGGFFVNDDDTEATTDTPENLATLKYIMTNVDKGTFGFPEDLEAAWAGEAFGSGKAAMTIEGAWIVGALENDFPERKWEAVELPAGPAGRNSTVFTNCWGIAADSQYRSEAVDLVEHLVSPAEQKAAAKAFGPTPSRSSLAGWSAATFPEEAVFASGMNSGRAQVSAPGYQSVLDDFNTQLELMVTGNATPEQALKTTQANGEAALAQN